MIFSWSKRGVLVLLLFQSSLAVAQFPDFEDIVASGKDVNTYMQSYVSPFMNAFGTGISNGWYNTAAPHQSLGFDLTIYGSFVAVPDEERFFQFMEEDYASLRLTSGASSASLPTLLGGSTSEQLFATYTDPESGTTIDTDDFVAPGGLDEELPTNYAPVPMVQVALGIVKNTEIIVRYTPSVSIGDNFELKFFGLGIKHDIKQWIPGLKSLPFDMSVLVGYTNLDSDYDFSSTNIVETTNGRGTFDVNTWTFQALVSKKISVLTIYGSLGYNTISSNFKMTGTYSVEDGEDSSLRVDITDPVDTDYPLSSARATLGLRLKFAIFTFHGDYTFQKYNTITAGIGISVR